MFDYGKTAATATRLIERFGLTVTLRRIGATTYDPSTGVSAASETVLQTRGIFVDIEQFATQEQNDSGLAKQSRVTGTGVSQADIAMILQAAVKPAEGDRLEADGRVYSVVTVLPVSPAMLPVIYRVTLKAN